MLKYYVSIALTALIGHGLASDPMANYKPFTDVKDQSYWDYDQTIMETSLYKKTVEGFAEAKAIYEEGGNSLSYVTLTLDAALTKAVVVGTEFAGRTFSGTIFIGYAYEEAAIGDTALILKYKAGKCQVGALLDIDLVTDGCLNFFPDSVTDGTNTYSYKLPNATRDNKNGRSIQLFSTAVQDDMLDCKACPEVNAGWFMDYYQKSDWGDQWVQAALTGGKTDFGNGNADFGQYGYEGKIEVIKKGTAYVTLLVYAMHKFEAAVAACKDGLPFTNDDAAHMWDEGVAFYVGSKTGKAAEADGKGPWALGEKRCRNFGTCGFDGTEYEGKAQVNHKLEILFKDGLDDILAGNCAGADADVKLITEQVYIPLIQGSLRYANKLAAEPDNEKGQAEGAVFAAGVLPRVAAESIDAADIIYENMKVSDDPQTDFTAVKEAFESVYASLNIDCEMVGGYSDGGVYLPNAVPCVTECTDDRNASLTVVSLGLSMTCLQLANTKEPFKSDFCAKGDGACPLTCAGKCKCTDSKKVKFNKKKGGKMSCFSLSKKKNYKNICKNNPNSKVKCASTCNGWCKFTKPFDV